ncbi:Ca(2+)-dependent cysteine protease [Chytridiales sp. JEL 0842]|nr:Ca(2+)-dependent cysteine protease [Chytridiales sp. JEL 0842]
MPQPSKALLIGIRYLHTPHPLQGPHNDTHAFYTYLTTTHHPLFPPSNILVLSEDQPDPLKWPTRANILRGMQWLVEGSTTSDEQEGGTLVFYFGGHGAGVVDLDGDEVDGVDEVLLPLDWEEEGGIVDDDIFRLMVQPLSTQTKLIAILDCCHSASLLDLQYTYRLNGSLELLETDSSSKSKTLEARLWMGNQSSGFWKSRRKGEERKKREALKNGMERRVCKADVVQISACRDWERSVDVDVSGKAQGLMTTSLLSVLNSASTLKKELTLAQLLEKVRELVKQRGEFGDVMLSTGKWVDVRRKVFGFV